jgi:hypothetical protein
MSVISPLRDPACRCSCQLWLQGCSMAVFEAAMYFSLASICNPFLSCALTAVWLRALA